MTLLPILLAEGFTPTVTSGDKIAVGQVIAEQTFARELSVNLAHELEVAAATAAGYLLKNPGDAIQPGEVIARKRRLLGLKQIQVISKIPGIIARYQRDNGELKLASGTTTEKHTLLSPIDGVVGLCDNGKIIIETDKEGISATDGIGESAIGELVTFSQENIVQLSQLDIHSQGKVLLGGNFPRESLIKALGVGAKGIIATTISQDDLVHLARRQVTMPILIIQSEQFQPIAERTGKPIFLDGNTKTILFP